MTRTPRRQRGESRPTVSPERMALVAGNLRRLAACKGIPIAHVADHAGIGRTTMWRIVDANGRGASEPRLGTLEALSQALDVDLVDLLRPAPEPTS